MSIRAEGHSPRPEKEILQDLEKICTAPGYVHALSFLCGEGNFIGYSDEMAPENLDKMASPEPLLRSEISLLLGLMIKSTLDICKPPSSIIQNYIDDTKNLMEELHSSMSRYFWEITKETGFDFKKNSLTHGQALREPFFYSGESAYMFQYRDFSTEKYKNRVVP